MCEVLVWVQSSVCESLSVILSTGEALGVNASMRESVCEREGWCEWMQMHAHGMGHGMKTAWAWHKHGITKANQSKVNQANQNQTKQNKPNQTNQIKPNQVNQTKKTKPK